MLCHLPQLSQASYIPLSSLKQIITIHQIQVRGMGLISQAMLEVDAKRLNLNYCSLHNDRTLALA